jgi:Rod binding domain-containing protein
MKKIWVFIICMCVGISSFVPSVPIMDYSSMNQLSLKEKQNDEKVIEEMQARYIELMLTKPLFQSDLEFFESDDEEENFIGSSQEKQFFQQMLSREMAMELARQDLLGLKRMYLEQGL